MAPLVSVIVPVYNVSPYLRQCMDSIVNQTLKDIEIICVDDGSTDDSLAILQEYAEHDSRITILQQENKGAGAARNLGITKATGKYLSFLDSDDFFEKDMLNKAVGIAEKYTAEITVFGARKYNTNTRKSMKCTYGIEPYYPRKFPFSSDELIDHNIACFGEIPWNKLFNHDFIIKNNLSFLEVKNNNDLTFVLHSVFLAQKIAVINEVLIYYRIGMKTNTQSKLLDNPLNNYMALLELRKQMKKSSRWQKYDIFFVNHALQSCIGHLNKYKLSNQDIYTDVLSFFCQEGFDKLGINTYSKKHYTNKWIYRQYTQNNLRYLNHNYDYVNILTPVDYLIKYYSLFKIFIHSSALRLKLYGLSETVKYIALFICDRL